MIYIASTIWTLVHIDPYFNYLYHDFIKSYDLAHQLNIDPVKDNKIMSKVSKIMINKMGFKKSKRNNARGFKRL